jgi:hypothetical protein
MWTLFGRGYGYSEIGRNFYRSPWTVMHAVTVHPAHAEYINRLTHRFIHGNGAGFPQETSAVHRAIEANRRIVRPMPKPPLSPSHNPSRAVVVEHATAAALAFGVSVGDVLGSSRFRQDIAARKQAWRTLLAAGHSTNAIAKSWGCARKGIQRFKLEMHAEGTMRMVADRRQREIAQVEVRAA